MVPKALNSYDGCEVVATRRFAKLEKREDITGYGEAIVLGIQELLQKVLKAVR